MENHPVGGGHLWGEPWESPQTPPAEGPGSTCRAQPNPSTLGNQPQVAHVLLAGPQEKCEGLVSLCFHTCHQTHACL